MGLWGADSVLSLNVRIGHRRWIQFVKIYRAVHSMTCALFCMHVTLP